MNARTDIKTIALLVVTMALWGGTWVAGRIVSQSVGPWTAAFLRFLLAAFFLVAMCLARGGTKAMRVERRQLLSLLMLGATGFFGYSALFFAGLKTVEAGRAALIVGCIPSCIALGATFVYRERISLRIAAGILLSLGGVAVIMGNGNLMSLLSGGVKIGDLMIVGCVLCWSSYTLIGRPLMKAMAPLTAVTWACMFGVLLLLPFAFSDGLVGDIRAMGRTEWASLVYLGPLGASLAYLWYYDAVKKLGPVKSGLFINLVPCFGVLFGCLFLDERLSLWLLVGGAMVISGVTLATLRRVS